MKSDHHLYEPDRIYKNLMKIFLCPVCKYYGPVWINLGPFRINYAPAHKDYGPVPINYYGPVCINYGLVCINYGLVCINYGLVRINYGSGRKITKCDILRTKTPITKPFLTFEKKIYVKIRYSRYDFGKKKFYWL